MSKPVPKGAMRYALLASMSLAFTPCAASAADAIAAPAAASQPSVSLGKIMVTGTAIPRTSIETPAPVTVFTAQEIKQTGLTTLADVVRTISADNSGTIPTAFTGGFAAGSSGLALRGLTVNSTLILIDGHRTAAYALADDGERSFTDLNSIPLNAVERIEVLKDGASSLYGADAIAGVVNIILYKSFTHSQAAAEVGTSQHGGGTSSMVTYLSGSGDLDQDHYNAYMNFEYHKDDAIYNRDRGFPYNTNDLTSIGGIDQNIGNPGVPNGSTFGSVAPATVTGGDITTGNATGPFQPLQPCTGDGKLITVAGTGPGTGTYCEENFVAKYSQIQPEVDRIGISGRITVKLSDATQARLDSSYFQTRVVSLSAPSQIQNAIPNNTNAIALPPTLLDGQLNPNDPFASSGKYALINYAFGDIPGGFINVNHNMRMVADVNHMLNDNWSTDTALVLNHTWLNINNFGFISFPQLEQDIQTGAYSFIDPASNSQAVRDALSPTLAKTSTTDMDALDFNLGGTAGQLQGGNLGLAFGAQWRYEAQDDPDLNPNDSFQGLGIAHTIGHRSVAAVFAEVDAPVLPSLDVDVSAREDHYSDFGSAFSPKLGMKWTPSPDFSLRGTYSKGFRAPSFSENGSSAAEGFITETLPAAFMTAHGNDAYVQPYSLGLLTSANPNIQPERSRNYTFGAVFQPLESLSGTLDYYNIQKTGVIAQSAPDSALAAYFAGQAIPPGFTVTTDLPDPAHPSALPRPILVASPYVNENELDTDGIDLSLTYSTLIGGDTKWSSKFEGTDILKYQETLDQGGPFVSYVGNQGPYILSSGAGTPKYRASWANTFDFGRATVTGTFYYTSGLFMSAPDDTGPGTENLCFSTATPTGANLPADCRKASFTYFDVEGDYKLNDTLTVTAAILNFFDRKAPLDQIDYAGVNYNPTYDQSGAIGRFFTLGLQATF